MSDAVVIGAGPNGLVAANLLADHGWSVTVIEEQPTPGGGVRSAELMEPSFVNDRCSAFYPLAAVSKHIQSLRLEQFGVQWLRAPVAIAHPGLDGECPAIHQDVDDTARSLGVDGDAWCRMIDEWRSVSDDVIDALVGSPFPPLEAVVRITARRSRPPLLDLARLAVLPVRRLGDERFQAVAAKRLLAGLALHADLGPETPLSGFFGWLLASLAQDRGFPVPLGGAQRVTDALVNRLASKGGAVQCRARVARIVVRGGRAVAVRLSDGSEVAATRAVIADVDAPQLYLQLLDDDVVPTRVRDRITRFVWDHATFKVDWNLNAPIPWIAEAARRSGTVHVADSVDELTMSAASIAAGCVPQDPFVVLGQYAAVDSTRQPQGRDTAWAYTHVPRTTGIPFDASAFADALERRVEALAPGFRALIRRRQITRPEDFTAENRSMPGGALNLGTSQLHEQLVFRPIPGWGRSETPIRALFLASASAHPGGGVHGACGAHAARAAVLHDRLRRVVRRGARTS